GPGHHDRDALIALALAIAGAALLRLILTVTRRLVAGRVSLGVEYDLRQRMYEHLQRLELAFFDRQQTGQLMSRATVDLQSVRFFLGYGLVFMTQSALTILLAAAGMFAKDTTLAAISLAPVPLVVFIAARYGRRRRPARRARADDARGLHGVLRVPADAAGADAHAGHLAGHGAARDRLGRAAVPGARPRSAAGGAPGRAAAAGRVGARRVARRVAG